MKTLRTHRRILGAIMLALVCCVVSAAPAAASARLDGSLEEQLESRVSRFVAQVELGVSGLFQKLGVLWNAAGAIIED